MKWVRNGILIFSIAWGIIGNAFAAPSYDELTGVRLYLSTTDFELMDSYTSSVTVEGFQEPHEIESKYEAKLDSTTLDGYIRRYSFDPSVITTTATRSDIVAGTRGKYGFEFIGESDIVEIKYPLKALVNTGRLDPLYLPIAVVTRIERRNGKFDGHDALGEPFYMPPDQAATLQKRPVFSCDWKSFNPGRTFWVSYNKKVREKELGPICKSDVYRDRDKNEAIKRKSNVFRVDYPTKE